MATPPGAPVPTETGAKPAGKTRSILLIALSALFVACLVFLWTTRGAMGNLAFLSNKSDAPASFGKRTLVDVSTWQTAQALAALAVTSEETEYAQDAERLADHEVDQAFAAALRQARLRVEHRTLTGEALALSQRVKQLQQLVAQDQALVKSLTPPAGTAGTPAPDSDDLDVAKAQLGLDSDELDDAQDDLARASGDDTSQIQDELTAHEASMKQYDSASHNGAQVASVSVRQHGTLAGRVQAWFSQQDRYNSIVQAQQKAQQDVTALTAEHNKFETQADAPPAGATTAADHTTKLANLKDRSSERQILTIYDDRIQTNQQLASVYSKWAAQVVVQHRIVLNLILRSFALILFILICMLICDALVRKLMSHPALDRRQTQTLRGILQLSIQVLGVILILLVIFGIPKELPTILGLATAALTVALQDFILAFLGWFILIGKNGLRVSDWVEINGVGGEVVEVGLFSTTLLETGALDEKGYPTGRRISFPNSFAIKGAYFNFSTRGQWMWDDITVTVPTSANTGKMIEKIHAAVEQETEENAHLAQQEWQRSVHGKGLNGFNTVPVVNLRPSPSGISAQVRYVTRASERFELRNRLYKRVIDLLQEPDSSGESSAATKA
jgi:small-conductance mechanosensitive channel